MMMCRENNKITSVHLAKKAIVYIRQSTMRQVFENSESTMRQYNLKQKLIDLGWPLERIQIIDQDLGKSGADSDRNGFQTVVAEVSNGLIGAVACIECSRLSRDSEDWIKLTKFCAYTNTLLIDADGIYDPNSFNDSLLLGLKGTMNAAELHILKERMFGGLMNKAKRGELMKPIPIGYIYDNGKAIKDPDIEIQKALELLFDVFRRHGSAHSVVKHYKVNHIKFPHKQEKGFGSGSAEWRTLDYATALRILHNPYYAGVYCYGRKQWVWTSEGRKIKKVPREEWHVFIKDHHDSYISFEEFETNEKAIDENRLDTKIKREKTPPREGPSLLQGLVYCGKCGNSMRVNYQYRAGQQLVPIYRCDNDLHRYRSDLCQSVPGMKVDQKIAEILIDRLTPEAISQAISVQKELDNRQTETLSFFQMRVDKSEYEAGMARKRYMRVDPDNRLVALQLEESWNKALRELDDARNEYAFQAEAVERLKKECDYLTIENLPQSFSEAFLSSKVNNKDKKRMVRYLIEDVTLLKSEGKILIQIRFKGNTTQVIEIDAPLPASQLWVTDPAVVKFIDDSAEDYCDKEIADLLNGEGYKTGTGLAFTKVNVRSIMRLYSIPNKKKRYMSRGYITSVEKAAIMGITLSTLHGMIKRGKYQCDYVSVNTQNELLFPPLVK